jgi:alpha-methylacyl-CoA racemase
MAGPLEGLRIIEMAGIGPGPFACMMLADHGAEVIRVERPGGVQAGPAGDPAKDVLLRSRRTIAVDLKSAKGITIVRDLVRSADGLVEGFRPGVMERLGLGPDVLMADNPRP